MGIYCYSRGFPSFLIGTKALSLYLMLTTNGLDAKSFSLNSFIACTLQATNCFKGLRLFVLGGNDLYYEKRRRMDFTLPG